MIKIETDITIWHNAIGYGYSDDYISKGQLSEIESFGLLIARLAAMIQNDEDVGDVVVYQIEIVKDVYND
jgi:hypothetical protein